MKYAKADSGYKRVLMAKAALWVKIEALQKMSAPSARLLTQLVRDSATHPKLRLLAANKLAELQRQRAIDRVLRTESNRLEGRSK